MSSDVLFKNKVHVYKCKNTFIARLWVYDGDAPYAFVNTHGKGATALAARDDLMENLVALKKGKKLTVEHLKTEINLIDAWQQKYQGEYTESEMVHDPESFVNEMDKRALNEN